MTQRETLRHKGRHYETKEDTTTQRKTLRHKERHCYTKRDTVILRKTLRQWEAQKHKCTNQRHKCTQTSTESKFLMGTEKKDKKKKIRDTKSAYESSR